DSSALSEHAAYAPQLSPDVASTKLLVFASTMANLSYGRDDVTGAGGLGTLLPRLGAAIPRLGARIQALAPVVEHALFLACMGLVGLTLWQGRRAGWALLFPLLWIAAYFGPTLLTRNIQMYYLYEPVAGAAVLLALCLDRSDRRLRKAWVVALLLIAANG